MSSRGVSTGGHWVACALPQHWSDQQNDQQNGNDGNNGFE